MDWENPQRDELHWTPSEVFLNLYYSVSSREEEGKFYTSVVHWTELFFCCWFGVSVCGGWLVLDWGFFMCTWGLFFVLGLGFFKLFQLY